ncbi:EAL domain-containing response regulator [Derxia gummosa]|uniref:EAL domain-containing response regulator n=1 Tax=Derxia gummosa DSM 723 TaxID=1121388 RepID=A0A8B6X1D5_9BURK|nr:EAL domain-containing response regulator [Derxia gummosa]
MTPPLRAPTIAGRPPSALIIEDDSFFAAQLCQQLAQAGVHELVELGSVAEADAFDFSLVAPVDLALVSLSLYDGDCLGLLRRLMEARGARRLLLLSAHSFSIARTVQAFAEVLGFPVVQVVEKSEPPQAVSRAIAHALRTPVPAAAAPLRPLSSRAVAMAIAEERIEAFFQPKIQLATGEVVGVEALVRLREPDGHIVSPAEILPGLIGTGSTSLLTLQMLRQAARLSADCLDLGQSIACAINVSTAELADSALCEEMAEIVGSHGIDPCWITLEVTEGEMMGDLAATLENAARVRMVGFGLAIDDFGTGYSSFQRLSTIPFSELKVDRAFVHGAARDERARLIAKVCGEIGRTFGLRTVAEGVENRDDLAVVRDLGFDYVQGWVYGKAMPRDEFMSFLQRSNALI